MKAVYVCSVHVTTGTSALYVTIVQWEPLQMDLFISFSSGRDITFIACCSKQEAHSQLMRPLLSCSQSNSFPPCQYPKFCCSVFKQFVVLKQVQGSLHLHLSSSLCKITFYMDNI